MRFDGIDLHANLRTFRSVLGYVPQDDIIHADLPLAAHAPLRRPAPAPVVDNRGRGRRRGPDAIDAVGLSRRTPTSGSAR